MYCLYFALLQSILYSMYKILSIKKYTVEYLQISHRRCKKQKTFENIVERFSILWNVHFQNWMDGKFSLLCGMYRKLVRNVKRFTTAPLVQHLQYERIKLTVPNANYIWLYKLLPGQTLKQVQNKPKCDQISLYSIHRPMPIYLYTVRVCSINYVLAKNHKVASSRL